MDNYQDVFWTDDPKTKTSWGTTHDITYIVIEHRGEFPIIKLTTSFKGVNNPQILGAAETLEEAKEKCEEDFRSVYLATFSAE